MKNQNLKFKSQLQERAYKYAIRLLNFVDVMPKSASCETITKQLLRSGTSIGANVVEAHAASSRRDFTNYFHYALKSANETEYWLCLLRDAKNLKNQELECLIGETTEMANILA